MTFVGRIRDFFLLTRFDTTLPVEIWNPLRPVNPKTNVVGSLVLPSPSLVVLFELTLLRRKPA
jgi:spermidine/putrescine transport system permease protein